MPLARYDERWDPMSASPLRVLTRRAAAILGAAVLSAALLSGCAATADPTGNGPTEASERVLEQFFAHLEAGEFDRAAELTDLEFAAPFLDPDFTAATASPRDARILELSGTDSHRVSATVEYVLDDPELPVTASFTVTHTDGTRAVSWPGAEQAALIMNGAPGRVTLNDQHELAGGDGARQLTLLPGLYSASYQDPTGTTALGSDGETEFTFPVPTEDTSLSPELPARVSLNGSMIVVTAPIKPGIIDEVEAQIRQLTDACGQELLLGPSCPPALLDDAATVADPASIEWFRDPNETALTVGDGEVRYAMGFTVRADDKTFPMPAVYVGTVTRDATGTVAFAPDSPVRAPQSGT